MERETLFELVEELKVGLVSHATGGKMDTVRYLTIRKTLLGVPDLAERLPSFIRSCRNPDEFWGYIKEKSDTYQGRRNFLAEKLNPVLDYLEQVESTIEEHFTIGEQIGSGGFGAVYKVKHELLDVNFAIKVFSPAFDDGEQAHLDRFFREARVLLALNHPSIIRVYDVGLIEGKPFIRMDFFDGLNLNQILSEYGALTPCKALRFVCRVLEAIEHAHNSGVVHRDLKPSNVMLALGEQVRVVDFGLGVFVEDDLVSRITNTGEAAVGGLYTAPELIAEPRLIDPRSDLYSVSALWYTTLVGQAPAGVDVGQALASAVDLEADYSEALLAGLRNVDSRHQSASDMLAAINELSASDP